MLYFVEVVFASSVGEDTLGEKVIFHLANFNSHLLRIKQRHLSCKARHSFIRDIVLQRVIGNQPLEFSLLPSLPQHVGGKEAAPLNIVLCSF